MESFFKIPSILYNNVSSNDTDNNLYIKCEHYEINTNLCKASEKQNLWKIQNINHLHEKYQSHQRRLSAAADGYELRFFSTFIVRNWTQCRWKTCSRMNIMIRNITRSDSISEILVLEDLKPNRITVNSSRI